MKKTIFIFGLLILAILLLFHFSKYAVISGDLSAEVVVAIIAIVFFFVGIYINKKSLHKPTTTTTEIDHEKIKELDISNREYEVLQKIAEGLSNKEIAESLFLSESTIKTHVSNLLVKLDAQRRTQAVQKAKSFQIL
ncbi:response regulator transcription factor [Psychroserpens sp.]|uniref:response regulator transcription factor n=1 Tax=Psychroserpens sp. TaxID=2020870 RepID=UPI001B147B39|nr:response regulator transcription factor [Psychroserpens sp.]MBO6607725.1 response regulator transcription factor [Psychroserpens sp.]MBO6630932.1 response regulator transcription factor [Psychroserpens sp.]MBO6654716.1 response regulator transcription factor [Psychroserpens sp.]MBO6682860.1 response regulator transcription factor [Psychroserpens sp.]MBO6751083.1 response regulator transcription factor [Psychroserpens sp.]